MDVDFLLTNDDGIDADGIEAFRDAMRGVGSLVVVAPDTVRSCCSHGVSTRDPLRLERVAVDAWKVSGTPADCVRVAIKHLGVRPQWILSGVNEGGNLGVDIHYSGTVAGAREGALLGYPAMAISQYLRRDRPRDWKLSAQRAIHAFESLRSLALSPHEFWNVNLPVVDHREVAIDIVHTHPEPEMLGFDFEQIEPDSKNEPEQETIRWLQYRSNYQERPRSVP